MVSPNLLTSTYCGNLRVKEGICHTFFFSLTAGFPEFNSINKKNISLTRFIILLLLLLLLLELGSFLQ